MKFDQLKIKNLQISKGNRIKILCLYVAEFENFEKFKLCSFKPFLNIRDNEFFNISLCLVEGNMDLFIQVQTETNYNLKN